MQKEGLDSKLWKYTDLTPRFSCLVYRIVGNFRGVQKFILCYLQLIRVFNFHSVHFTQENMPIIMYIS